MKLPADRAQFGDSFAHGHGSHNAQCEDDSDPYPRSIQYHSHTSRLLPSGPGDLPEVPVTAHHQTESIAVGAYSNLQFGGTNLVGYRLQVAIEI